MGKAAEGSKQEDEWLETEKRVVVIHRLHQILEPFMLRRQVEDVESKLPPKVILLLTPLQGSHIGSYYHWCWHRHELCKGKQVLMSSAVKRMVALLGFPTSFVHKSGTNGGA